LVPGIGVARASSFVTMATVDSERAARASRSRCAAVSTSAGFRSTPLPATT